MAQITPLERQASVSSSDEVTRLDQSMRVVRPRGWVAFTLLTAVLAAIVVWSIAGSFPLTATGQGILMRPPGIYRIEATQDGTITDLHLPQDGVVHKGDLVAHLLLSNGTTQEIRSQEDGRVIAVFVSPFQYVTTGAPIGSLEPPTNRLEAVVYVPVEQGKDVRTGMNANLSASGAARNLSGTVTSVAAYPATPARIKAVVQNDALDNELTGGRPVYEVVIELDAVSASAASSGAVCTAQIVLKQRRPISLAFPQSEPS